VTLVQTGLEAVFENGRHAPVGEIGRSSRRSETGKEATDMGDRGGGVYIGGGAITLIIIVILLIWLL